MAVLSACESSDFQFLLKATKLNKGNLSAQAIKLEESGYISVEKGFHGRTPFTLYRLTESGRTALKQYRQQLKRTLDHL
jgi:DNA-binding PadR family transcriptional regulator